MNADDHLLRLLPKIAVSEHCWEWTGPRHYKGYGKTGAPGPDGSRFAHRVVYQYLVGPIPSGLVLDHLCGNKWCVNPTHLEPVTSRENTIRACGAVDETKAVNGLLTILASTQ